MSRIASFWSWGPARAVAIPFHLSENPRKRSRRWVNLQGHPVTGTLVCVSSGARDVAERVREQVGARFPSSFSVTQLREAMKVSRIVSR